LHYCIDNKHELDNIFRDKSPIKEIIATLNAMAVKDPVKLLGAIPVTQLKAILLQIDNTVLPI